jgi:hypothetical protein
MLAFVCKNRLRYITYKYKKYIDIFYIKNIKYQILISNIFYIHPVLSNIYQKRPSYSNLEQAPALFGLALILLEDQQGGNSSIIKKVQYKPLLTVFRPTYFSNTNSRGGASWLPHYIKCSCNPNSQKLK